MIAPIGQTPKQGPMGKSTASCTTASAVIISSCIGIYALGDAVQVSLACAAGRSSCASWGTLLVIAMAIALVLLIIYLRAETSRQRAATDPSTNPEIDAWLADRAIRIAKDANQ
jgi:hypothetical protein